MKRKKGFTLIELLAIIVILAIIAVVITPVILEIIEDSKISAATDSAYGYKDSVQKYYATMLSQNSDFMLDGEYTINRNGSISDTENTYDILASGTIPKSGTLNIEKGSVVSGCIQINEYAVRLEDKKVTNTEKGNCKDTQQEPVEIVVEEFPQVNDTNPGIICGTGETEDYNNSTVCYIYSVEDLVAFSNMVNSGKNFQGKTVQLMNNLDIQNDKSYTNVNANSFGDINEDSTTSTTLKEELTTGKGFKPIGNDTNKFAGTFEGNVKKIKNLYINRSSENYVGLFGYNEGTIKGLKVIDANVEGNSKVGIIAGYNAGNITSMIASGNAKAVNYIGLLIGENKGLAEGIVSGNVTATSTSDSSAGGLVGSNYGGTLYGIYKEGKITYAISSYVSRTIGYAGSDTRKTGALDTIIVGSNTKNGTSLESLDGYNIPTNAINNIAIADVLIDTYVGGDNNNDGYYYDNDTNGELTIYKLSDKPLNITMTGSGTQNDPYIINNYEQLKQVSYIQGAESQNLYYKLNIDIDLTNKSPIILGRSTETNTFEGIFDGNTHTINNLTLYGHDYTGLFGYNKGTVRGLKVTGANITGYQYVGILAGENAGSITSIIADGNVNGVYEVGIAVGKMDISSATLEAVTSGNATSASTGKYADVGGIIGGAYNGTVNGIYKSGTITSVATSCVNRTLGDGRTSSRKTGALNTITVNGNTKTSTSPDSSDGYDIPANYINNIAIVDKLLDTFVGGDDNEDGYYYDYDSNGEFTIYSLTTRPLNITMSGTGTQSDPYIINNYDQLKQVAYIQGTDSQDLHYKLNADIDLSGKNTIILGKSSEIDAFSGTFDGNTHTISNLKLYGYDYTGLFGYNKGTIKGLKVTSANITGTECVGVISGENAGSITSIIADGNVNGVYEVGIAVGKMNTGTAKLEAVTSGNATSASTGRYADVGGIIGGAYNGTVNGIYKSGTITSVATSCVNRTLGDASTSAKSTGALDTITVNGNTRSSTSLSSTDGKSYTASELQTLAPYQEVGLNTSSTTGEYRYALDSNYNPYIIKNTSN